MAFILLGVGIVLASKLAFKEEPEEDPFMDLKREAHVYSGVNPTVFMHFISKFNLAQRHMYIDVRLAQKYMLESIDSLEDIALYAESGDYDIQEPIHVLAKKIGYAFENRLMNIAINKGVVLYPKYLNNRIN